MEISKNISMISMLSNYLISNDLILQENEIMAKINFGGTVEEVVTARNSRLKRRVRC